MEVWELVAREEIRNLSARYAHAADTGRFEEVASVFAPDGILEVHGQEPHRGRDAILAFLSGVGIELAAGTSVPLIRHHTSSVRIDVESPERARSASYFLAITEHGVDHWGRYRDELRPVDGHWLIAHRRVRTDGSAPGSWAANRIT